MALSRMYYNQAATRIATLRHEVANCAEGGSAEIATHVDDYAISVAGDFKRDNARFDIHRFLTACGLPDDVATTAREHFFN
jgi:hypothetical protein